MSGSSSAPGASYSSPSWKRSDSVQDAQPVVGQRIAVDLQVVHAPGIRVHRLDALVQPLFVVLVLLLEMLGAQEQAFAPENFAGHVAASRFAKR